MAEPNLLGALRDPEFRAQVKQGLKDAANRGVASFFGGPADLASMVMRPFGYATPDREVVGGSEWIGKQMEQRGMVSEARNPVAEFLAAVALPAGMTKAAPGIFRSEQKAIQNAMAPRTLDPQTGAIVWHGTGKKNDMSSQYIQDLVSSQRFIDRDIVAKKIKSKDFDVKVTPYFEINGEEKRAIVDGHHALEAAIRSGNKPNFIEMTPSQDDRVMLLMDGKIDDYLESAYHDSPWYNFANKRDLF